MRTTTEATYPASVVAAVTGLSKTLVQQYSDRGLLSFESVKAGNRTFRRFSYRDLLRAASLAVLRTVGINPLEATEIVENITTALSQYEAFTSGEFAALEDPHKWRGLRFALTPDGSNVPVFYQGEVSLKEVCRTLRENLLGTVSPTTNGPVFPPFVAAFVAVDVRLIVQQVDERLAKLEDGDE
jgi:DNA-binding transcriptional MerR regulator